MKRRLSEYRGEYQVYSKGASDVARSAAYAGIALIWVFHVDRATGGMLPGALLFPTAMFAAAIALDILQYLVGTILWWVFFRFHEGKLVDPADDPELDHSPWLPQAIWLFFWLKLVAVALGYWGVGRFIVRSWST
jgi:hypothetical protein